MSLFRNALGLTLLIAVAACSGRNTLPPTAGTAPALSTLASLQSDDANLGPENGYLPALSPDAIQPLCPATGDRNVFRCFAWMRTDLHGGMGTDTVPAKAGYSPAQIAAAYHLSPSRGAGQTVAIVDAYGYTAAESDLTAYRKGAGLPACTSASGCLAILNQKGQKAPLPPEGTGNNANWMAEEALDLDAVSAACPKCKIVLVQSKDANSNNLFQAAAAGGKLASIISMSWGGSEGGGVTPDAIDQPGHTYVSSAGDFGGGVLNGGGPQQPCTYANIVCVGGTRLTHSKTGTWSEVVWNDNRNNGCYGPCGSTGSACSTVVKKPSYQTDTAAGDCTKRSAADVAADASPFTPLAVYMAKYNGWVGIGGTSLAAPLIAGIIGEAGNGRTFGPANIWAKHTHLNDVLKGTNLYAPVTGPCASTVVYICTAGAGYDGPTGWGTPNGITDF